MTATDRTQSYILLFLKYLRLGSWLKLYAIRSISAVILQFDTTNWNPRLRSELETSPKSIDSSLIHKKIQISLQFFYSKQCQHIFKDTILWPKQLFPYSTIWVKKSYNHLLTRSFSSISCSPWKNVLNPSTLTELHCVLSRYLINEQGASSIKSPLTFELGIMSMFKYPLPFQPSG